MERSLDPSTAIAGVLIALVAVVVLGGGIATLVWWLVKRHKERQRIEALPPALRQLHEATLANSSGLKVARANLKDEIRAYEARVARAQQELAMAQQVGFRPLGKLPGRDGSMALFEDKLVVVQRGQQITHPLDPTVRAWVDAAGGVYSTERSTFTRMAGGAVVAGGAGLVAGAAARKTQVHDARELYISVEAQYFAITMACNPAFGPGARQFAAAITNAGRQAHVLQHQRPRFVAQAEASVHQARSSIARVRALEYEIAALEAAQSSVEASRRALEASPGQQSLPLGTSSTPPEQHPPG